VDFECHGFLPGAAWSRGRLQKDYRNCPGETHV
jgi:hypothetical protein